MVEAFDPLWLWAAVALSALASFVWRAFGVAAARRIQADGAAARWIACVAYAILAGLIARMIVLPIGVLEEAPLIDRLGALGLAFAVFFALKRNLMVAVAVALAAFVAITAYRAGDAAFAAGTDNPACQAPAPVCAWTGRVYPVAAFDPVGSATVLGPGLLATSRHVVADEERAEVFDPQGGRHVASVVPTDFQGDLILLRVDDAVATDVGFDHAAAAVGDEVYVVGADIGRGTVRVYAPGTVIAVPPAGASGAHIHHTAESGPGNSGGALVGAEGALVGIVAAGGEGRNEAVPAGRLAELEDRSGARFAADSRALGEALRACVLGLDELRGRRAEIETVQTVARTCENSANRQLMDNAAQALALGGDRDGATRLFERSLAMDPNAPNTLISQAITLHLQRRFADSRPLLERLLDMLPADLQVLRLAVHAAKFAPDPALGDRALGLMDAHYPKQAPLARKFLKGE